MDIYFVRHGETEHNHTHLHQPDDVPLNERGKKQAGAAEKLVHMLDPTYIISSTFTRASETAEILNERLLLAIDRSDLFVELRRPAHIVDRHHFGPASVWYMLRWFFSTNNAYWRRVGGESRPMFLERIRTAKQYLEWLPKDARVIVVSHSIFINYFIEHICNEKPIPLWRAVFLLLKIKKLDNSSITHVRFDPDLADGTCKWNVVSFDADEHVPT